MVQEPVLGNKLENSGTSLRLNANAFFLVLKEHRHHMLFINFKTQFPIMPEPITVITESRLVLLD
jgi:hypothetical protein